jgi:hypothetical protein
MHALGGRPRPAVMPGVRRGPARRRRLHATARLPAPSPCWPAAPPPRYQLGLYQPPLPPLELAPGEEQEWIELRPRWPLTGEKHRGSSPQLRSSKAPSKMARSLTEETREALAAPVEPLAVAAAAAASPSG